MQAGRLLVLLLLAGCATRSPLTLQTPATADTALEQRARQTMRELFPRGMRLTQRAIVNAAGRQFSCDGLLQIATDGDLRLALLAPMGVIAELHVHPDEATEVVKTAPSFPEPWVRQYVGTIARLLFAMDESAFSFGRLTDGRPVLWKDTAEGERWLYVFNADGSQWQEAEIARGRARLCHAVGTPASIHVTAPAFELDLRTIGR